MQTTYRATVHFHWPTCTATFVPMWRLRAAAAPRWAKAAGRALAYYALVRALRTREV